MKYDTRVFRRLTIIDILAVLSVLLVLLCFSLPPKPEKGSKRIACLNNIKNIALALAHYQSVHGSFPPAYVADENGKPMHSWRVLILPYLDQLALYKQYNFDEPWDGPNNRKLHDKHLSIFQCPSATHKHKTMTSYVVIVGSKTVFPGSESVSIEDITDGTDKAIMVVEMEKSGIHWMEPRDLNLDQMEMAINLKSGKGISSLHVGGANCAFCDGRVQYLSDKTSHETLRRLLEINDGEPLGDF